VSPIHPPWALLTFSSDLDDAFGSDEEDEQAPLNAHVEQPPHHVPGAYDFEREYDCPPPGSPPLASAFARPNDIGNSNGMLPTEPVIPPVPRSSFFRRAVGAILPTHYTRLPGSDPTASGVHGGGIENDGVFANVMAKPQRARTIRTEDGEIHLVPEDSQKEAPPVRSFSISCIQANLTQLLVLRRRPGRLCPPVLGDDRACAGNGSWL
jgi:hypothetical protein